MTPTSRTTISLTELERNRLDQQRVTCNTIVVIVNSMTKTPVITTDSTVERQGLTYKSRGLPKTHTIVTDTRIRTRRICRMRDGELNRTPTLNTTDHQISREVTYNSRGQSMRASRQAEQTPTKPVYRKPPSLDNTGIAITPANKA